MVKHVPNVFVYILSFSLTISHFKKKYFHLLALLLFFFFSCKKEKLEITFLEINSGTEKNIYGLFKLSPDTLFACGGENQKGFILHSCDSGRSWNTISNNFNRPLHSIYFTSSQNGICGGDSSNIYFTHDGGTIWNEYSDFIGVPYQYRVPLKNIFFVDSLNILAVGGKNFGRGIIYHSTDAGSNFHTHGFEHELRSVAKSSEGLFTVGYGTILESNDNENWKISNSTNEYFTGILFTDNTKGFACGYDGGIYKTTNGGKTWSTERKTNNSISTSREHFLCMDNFRNTIVICGFSGIMSYSFDNGENWNTGITFSETKINAVKLLNEKKGVAVGNGGKIFLFEL